MVSIICCIFVLEKGNNMKTTDHLVIIFEGNTFAIFSSSDKPIEKKNG